ncbi:MAG: lytic transglycosylase domain-containing protein [Acidobacteriota bacterium]
MPARTLKDSVSTRLARGRQVLDSHRWFRLLGGRGAMTVALGAALSIGGLSEALDGIHFVVKKDLDSVRVVRRSNRRDEVVASMGDGFAANTFFKLAQVLPGRLVTRQRQLFDDAWIPAVAGDPASKVTQPKRDVFHEEMARINGSIRQEFFANAIPFGSIIHEKAAKYDVDPALVAAVIEQESKFRTRARSQMGAQGLMQLMPRTGRWMGATNLYDPAQNVDAGVKYIKYLSGRFDGDLKSTIAAYNAGEGNVNRYGGVPPFRETQTYVRHVLRNYKKRNEEIKAYGAGRETATVAESR